MKSLQTRTTTFHSTPIVRSFLNQNYTDLSKSQSKFTDPLFPPSDTSLYSTKQTHTNYKLPDIPQFLLSTSKSKFLSQFALSKTQHNYEWKRLSEVYNIKDLNIIKESSSLADLCNDVIQGELGDCYFLSALSALAESPERIKRLLPTLKMSDKGVYETLVYLHGDPTHIVVDDYFPFIVEEGYEHQLAFAGINPVTNNIWPLLLEKVWAKCNLSYEDIVAGNSAEAFEFLCPAPFDTFYHNADTTTLFDVIEKAKKKRYIIVSDITETENTDLDALSKMGLITNHAYSVIDTAKLTDRSTGHVVRLLKVRNPWGTNEWLGDWSDGSKKWTSEFKATVGLEAKEDGVFWMSYEDFITFYTSTHICHLHDGYEFITKKFLVQSEEPFNVVSVNIPNDANGYFVVNMKNTRVYKNLKGLDEFENPYCCITVFRKDNNNKFTYIGSDSGHQNRLYVECDNMIKGVYYVVVTFPKQKDEFEVSQQLQYKAFEKMTYRVGVYSPFDDLNINELTEKDKASLGNFLERLITSQADALPSQDKYTFTNEGEKTSWRAVKFDETSKSSYGFIYYNNSSDAFIRERITITELYNVNIVPMLKEGQFTSLQATTTTTTTAIDEEVEYDDALTRKAMANLKQNVKLDSTVDVIESPTNANTNAITASNPIIIQCNVAPHSTCIILLQKTDDDAGIDFISDICFDYLPNALLSGDKFRSKKFMLKYNSKPIEVYECVTEHNTGVLFQYKNKTKDMKVTVKVVFNDLDNLYLSIVSDDVKGKDMKLRNSTAGKFRDDLDEDSVEVTVLPGQTKFFGIRAVDPFEKVSYKCKIDYQFNIAKGEELKMLIENDNDERNAGDDEVGVEVEE